MEETAEQLEAYVDAQQPSYEVLTDLPLAQRRAFKRHVIDTFHEDLSPVTVVFNNRGEVLKTFTRRAYRIGAT